MARVETGLMATVERTSNPATEPATVPVLEPVPETVPPETASTRLATIPTSVPPTTPSTTVHPSVHRALKAQVEPTTCTVVPEKGLTWILDSGASQHMATSRVPLTNAIANNDVRIRVANGEALTSPMEGAITLRTAHSDRKLHLKTVLGHASMHGNLMSVSTLCKSKDVKGVLYTEDKAQVLSQDGGVLMEAHVLNGLYIIDDVFVVDPNWNQPDHSNRNQPDHDALLASTQVELELQEHMLWHARLAHLSHSGMDKLLSANVVDGLDGLKVRDVHATKHSDELCVGCITGKAHRTAFSKTPSERTKATRLLGRIHADECGPMQVASGDMGALYMLLLIDEYSRKACGFFLKKKSDAATKIMEWCTSVSAYHNLSIGEFHTDGGGEFASTELLQFFKDRGITVTTTPPYTPQHNAIAERMNRTILESTRAMLLHAKAPQSLWAEAAQYAIHVRNVGGVRTDVRNTPDGIWTGKRTSVKHLRVFGCDAWMHVPAANRQKLDAKATICLFVGYNPDMTYRVLDVTTGKTHHSRDVTFAETKFTQCTALTEQELLASDGTVVNKDFYDFLQLSRFNTETELAKVISLQIGPSTATTPPVQPNSTEVQRVPKTAGVEPRRTISNTYGRELGSGAPGLAPTPGPVPLGVIATTSSTATSTSQPPVQAVKFKDDVIAPGPVPVQDSDLAIRRSSRSNIGIPASRYGMVDLDDVGAYLAQIAADSGLDPSSLEEAMHSADHSMWSDAIDAELASLARHNTWTECPVPAGKKAIGSKLVFKKKRSATGTIARYKVRLVVQGYSQREGVDYDRTFAPVLYYTSLRIILVLVAARDYEFKQMDVETAFLNAKLEEEVYITLPVGLDGSDSSTPRHLRRTYKLDKNLYGIKQAPRGWNLEINGTIIALGYTRCTSDSCVYVKTTASGRVIIVGLFVDDVFIAYSKVDEATWEADKRTLSDKYTMKDLGDAHLVLGMRITRDRSARTLKLDQEVYINQLLASCQMADCIPADTPAVEGVKQTSVPTTTITVHRTSSASSSSSIATKPIGAAPDESLSEHSDLLRTRYGSVVGSLLYAALATRPDIAYAVNVLSRFISAPLPQHWDAVKRVLRYLKGTAHIGLVYRANEEGTDRIVLGPTYADADWAGDMDDRRSTTGVVMKINGTAVSWKSKKQTTTALSSAEAEYYAAGEATKEILWLRQLLSEIGCTQPTGTRLYGDNETAISIASNDTFHDRTKHIDMRHHFIREHVLAGTVDLTWISTKDQQADILTKALGKHIFTSFRALVMGSRD